MCAVFALSFSPQRNGRSGFVPIRELGVEYPARTLISSEPLCYSNFDSLTMPQFGAIKVLLGITEYGDYGFRPSKKLIESGSRDLLFISNEQERYRANARLDSNSRSSAKTHRCFEVINTLEARCVAVKPE